MTKPRHRDKESSAGDHSKRTSAPCLRIRDDLTLAWRLLFSKVGSTCALFSCSAVHCLLWLCGSLRPTHGLSALRRGMPLYASIGPRYSNFSTTPPVSP